MVGNASDSSSRIKAQSADALREGVPSWAHGSFRDQDIALVDQAIASAEKKTSAEIVVVIANQSTSRQHLPVFGALVGAVTVLVLEPMLLASPFTQNFLGLLPWWGVTVIGAAVGAGLSLVAGVARFLIPNSVEIRDVHRSSVLAFQNFGLRRTKDSSGVLIFVSLFEHRVEILGDEAVASKVDQEFWTRHCEAVANAARQGRLAKGIADAVQSMTGRLSEIIPPSSQNSDELCNRVRFWKQF